MPNPENVIGKGNRFKKGQSGNPNGRPKGAKHVKDALNEVLSVSDSNGVQVVERLCSKLVKIAMEGNIEAAKLIFDRTFGKVVTTIAETNSEGKDKDTQVLELPNGAKITIG